MQPLFKAALAAALIASLGAAISPARASTAAPSGINGFNDPGGFTLNANSGGPYGQDATAHGVPRISGGTLQLTTSQGKVEPGTFYGSENTSAYYNQKQYVGQFYASFVYHYNGSNPRSFGPGNGFSFILQNDPRGLNALGTTGVGNGQQGDGGTIQPSAAVEFGLFTGFGQNRGTQLAYDGDPGTGGTFRDPAPVKLVGANANNDDYAPSDPIYVTLSYDGATLTESLTDVVTQASYTTTYSANLPGAAGGDYAYVGFTGGTGAAVADQTITDFFFSNNAPAPPANLGPKVTVTAQAVRPSPASQPSAVTVTVTLTNAGGATADFTRINSVTLNGSRTSSALPTTPNLLAPNHTQTNTFTFSVPAGTNTAPFTLSGTYVDTRTNKTATFSASVRSLPISAASN